MTSIIKRTSKKGTCKDTSLAPSERETGFHYFFIHDKINIILNLSC